MTLHNAKCRVIEQFTASQVEELWQLYRMAWWSQARQLEDIRAMLAETNLAIGLCQVETGKLVAFVRVLTDFIYRGFLLDVIVHEDYRGQGLGKQLMETIAHHPQLQKLEVLMLICTPEMVPFYEKWGFTQSEKFCLMGQRHDR